jgi:hypothetical protein
MSCTSYWKGWFRWRFMLIVVCHFVIISLSFFDWWILTISLVSTNYSYISSVRISRSGIGDVSQVWLPWLDIGDLRQVLQFWLDIGDLSQVGLPWLDIGVLSQGWLPWLDIFIFLIPRILVLWFTIFWLSVYPRRVIVEMLTWCVFFCDCSLCWYWRKCWGQFTISINYHLSPKIAEYI